MHVMMYMSIFWILYGIMGLFGVQNIPPQHKGRSWTKDYIRCQGLSWLMLGVPWLAFYLINTFCFADARLKTGTVALILAALSVPSVVYTIIWDRKFNRLLEAETESSQSE